ncbi:replication initiation protein [Erwinia tracheiphila]|uniref:replication initiation protein n=1 Tax=Erwinia tracheiphila TaxID=65700 RepID=UPI002D802196|nr:replication initiation protein [Erwinia tracheiphila]
MPYLCDLEEQLFTKYKLSQVGALRSLFSWRLLELFEQMRKSDKKTGKKASEWLAFDKNRGFLVTQWKC